MRDKGSGGRAHVVTNALQRLQPGILSLLQAIAVPPAPLTIMADLQPCRTLSSGALRASTTSLGVVHRLQSRVFTMSLSSTSLGLAAGVPTIRLRPCPPARSSGNHRTLPHVHLCHLYRHEPPTPARGDHLFHSLSSSSSSAPGGLIPRSGDDKKGSGGSLPSKTVRHAASRITADVRRSARALYPADLPARRGINSERCSPKRSRGER